MEQTLVTINNKTALTTSYIVAEQLGVEHRSTMLLIKEHQERIEKHFGVLAFQMTKPQKGSEGGRPEQFAELTENQAHYILTLSRNTEQAMEVKALFVKAFSEAKECIGRLEQVIALHDKHQAHAIPFSAFDDFSRYLDLLCDSIVAQKKQPGANKSELTRSLTYVQECMKYIEAHEHALLNFTGDLLELYSADGAKPAS